MPSTHTQWKLTQKWEGLWRDLIQPEALNEACHDDVGAEAEHDAAHTQECPVLDDKNDLDKSQEVSNRRQEAEPRGPGKGTPQGRSQRWGSGEYPGRGTELQSPTPM